MFARTLLRAPNTPMSGRYAAPSFNKRIKATTERPLIVHSLSCIDLAPYYFHQDNGKHHHNQVQCYVDYPDIFSHKTHYSLHARNTHLNGMSIEVSDLCPKLLILSL